MKNTKTQDSKKKNRTLKSHSLPTPEKIASLSKQHREVYEAITELLPYLQVYVDYYVGNGLYLDIFIPRINVALEINGKQHYEFNPLFHKDILAFEEGKMRDIKKLIYCKENNIALYVVKYDEKFDVMHFVDFAIKFLATPDGSEASIIDDEPISESEEQPEEESPS